MRSFLYLALLSTCTFLTVPAQKVRTLDCLPDAVPAEQRRVRGLGSRNFTIGVAMGVWVSQEITSRVLRILVQERLGIHVDVYFAPSLDNPVEFAWIAGCNAANWDCANFNPLAPAMDLIAEYWNRADRRDLYLADVVDALDPEAFSRVVKVGSLGYIGSNDIFVWKWAIDEAFNKSGIWLDWWADLRRPEVMNHFTSYNRFNIAYGVYQWCSYDEDGEETNHSERSKLERLGYACNSSEEYNNPYRKTRNGVWDANGEYPQKVFPVLSCSEVQSWAPKVHNEYVALGYKCVGDGWFISPQCLAISPGDEWKEYCILVLSWGPDDVVVQAASLALLPVSVGTISYWDAYDEFMYDTAVGHLTRGGPINNVIFEWWTPDNTIGALYARDAVVSLERSRINFEDGLDAQPYSFTSTMHENVYIFAPEIAEFMTRFMISIDDMDWMLNTFPSYINDTVDLYDAEDRIACEWVQSHEDHWSSWVGKDSCRANTYFDIVGRICKSCPIGKVSKRRSEGIESCMPCHPGNVFESDSAKCKPCGFGSFANHSESFTECAMCKRGSYGDSMGASACKLCPDHFTTRDNSAARAEACFCAQNAYLSSPTECSMCPVGRVKLEVGSENISSCKCVRGSYLGAGQGFCSPCPEGLECAFASDEQTQLPVPLPGYWVSASRPFEVFLCISAVRCPGGGPNACGPNRDPSSLGCGVCIENTYLDGSDRCVSCDAATTWPIILTSLGASVIGLSILVFAINRDVLTQQNGLLTIASIVSLTFTGLQTLGLFRGVAVQITEPLKSIFAAMQLFSFDTKLLRTDCILGNGVFNGFVLRQLIVPIGIVMIAVIILSRKWFRPQISVKVEFTNTVGQVFTIFYISIVASSISPFIAYKHPGNSGWSIQSIPTVLMFSPAWNSLLIIGTISFVVVASPFAAMVFYGCYMHPRYITRPGYAQQMQMFRFLFFRFKQEAYYYGGVLVTRNLLLCLVPVFIRDDAIASIVATSVVLLFFSLVQMTLHPWKSFVTNTLDGALTAGLQLILVVVAANIEGQAKESSVEVMSYMVTVALLAAVVMSFSYVLYRYLRPNPWYHFFICHHKVGAAAQSRYLKLMIVQIKSKNVFIDSDNLLDLDGLFDVIKSSVGHLIVFLTKFTLARPWCSGEIVTAFRNRVRATKFIGPDFDMLAEHDYAELRTYIDGGGVQLAKYMITLEDIVAAYRWLLSSTVPSIMRCNSLRGLRPYDKFAFEILGIEYAEPRISVDLVPYDGLVFSSENTDFEATASVGIIVRCIQVKYFNMSAGNLIVLSDFDSHVLNDEVITDWVTNARASIVVLSVHSLSSSQQLLVICRNMEVCARLEKNIVVPVTLPSFVFPTGRYFEDVLPALERLDVHPEQRAFLVKAFFNIIAVNISTHASQTVISTQCDEVLGRLALKRTSMRSISMETDASRRTETLKEEDLSSHLSSPKVYIF